MLGVFDSVDDATQAISGIIGAGIIPAALEMMDQGILVAVEEAFHFGFPLDAEAILLIEVDGLEVGLDAQRDRVAEICRQHGAREVRFAADAKERLQLWKCRKQAFGAIGRLSPSYCTQDGVVPRTKLPHILQRIRAIGAEVRPADRQCVSRRRRQPAPDSAVRRAASGAKSSACWPPAMRFLTECLDCGGSVTGEHGIGLEKLSFMNRMFTRRRSRCDGAAARCAQSRRTAEPGQAAADGRGVRHGASASGAAGGAVITFRDLPQRHGGHEARKTMRREQGNSVIADLLDSSVSLV